MKTKMNLNETTRKAIVAAIAEITGEKAIYRAMPTCNYDIGEITVTKDGSIVCPDGSDILAALAAAGFFPDEAEAVTEAEEPTGLTVSLPEDGFTEASLDNLRKLVDAKASLMQKALGADRLDVTVADGKVSFPWWNRMPEPEETQEQPKHVQSVRSPVFSLPVYIDSPCAQRHPIYRLFAELIDILSICTSFCWIDCAKEQVGQK